MAMWDLEPVNPVSGRKGKRKSRKNRKQPEEEMSSGATTIVKTAADFMTAGMGMAVMSNMASGFLGAIKK